MSTHQKSSYHHPNNKSHMLLSFINVSNQSIHQLRKILPFHEMWKPSQGGTVETDLAGLLTANLDWKRRAGGAATLRREAVSAKLSLRHLVSKAVASSITTARSLMIVAH